MKFLATFLTTLATGQAVAAFNDSAPTRNLKGRQVASEQVAKPETMMAQNTKPRKMLHSMHAHVPAESRIVGGNNASKVTTLSLYRVTVVEVV